MQKPAILMFAKLSNFFSKNSTLADVGSLHTSKSNSEIKESDLVVCFFK